MSKEFTDGGTADKNMKLVARVIGGIIVGITLLLTFVINPHLNSDKFSSETMWEAVHPFHWWKIFGIIGFLFFSLYVLGLAGKTIYAFGAKPNSDGPIHVIAVVCVVLMITMYL